MEALCIGYGKGQIEPKIAPLVEAVQAGGFETFSSCEGHIDPEKRLQPFASIAFYASEEEAMPVHLRLLELRDSLACSWAMHAGFVLHRRTNEWALGWTIENCGIIETVDDAVFVERTVRAGWEIDIQLLIAIFRGLGTNPSSK